MCPFGAKWVLGSNACAARFFGICVGLKHDSFKKGWTGLVCFLNEDAGHRVGCLRRGLGAYDLAIGAFKLGKMVKSRIAFLVIVMFGIWS